VRSRRLYLTFFGFHAVLILCVASWDALCLVAKATTVLPTSVQEFSQVGVSGLSSLGEESFARLNPLTQLVRGYLHGAGIEGGNSYFAPKVGPSYKLVFEFRYPDGRVDYDSFAPENAEGAVRLASLLEQVVKGHSSTVREDVIKTLAKYAWQRYPGAVHVQAVFGVLKLPLPNEYRRGARADYDFLYAYDFSLAE
jgi:hypothetical protein